MLFNTNIDGDSASTFHYNCDGIFPTVVVILELMEENSEDFQPKIGVNLL